MSSYDVEGRGNPVGGESGDFPAEVFVSRRARICNAIGEDAHALIQNAPPPGGFVLFEPSKPFFYCCGLETPQAMLLIDGSERSSALYLHPRGEVAMREGAPPGLEDADQAAAITGADAVYPIADLARHLADVRYLYTPLAPASSRGRTRDKLLAAQKAIAEDPWDGRSSRENRLVARLRSRYPRLAVEDLTPILDRMRSVKDPHEVEAMRRAGALCARAVREAMRATRPGVFEYQLGALAEYLYRLAGARGAGYRPIIASGENIWYIHYYRNDAPLRAGDLVLMDVAPEWHHYTSDIGRMWPVSGRYEPWQRELYGYIVEYHKTLLAKIRPGVTPDQVMDEAADAMREVWETWAFSKDIYREGARRTLTFRQHLSHPVGLTVHDEGTYDGRPLVPGTAFAVDPQMWIPEEKRYIRVEDTVVVTEDGVEVLTRGAPLAPDDIEAWMAQGVRALPYTE